MAKLIGCSLTACELKSQEELLGSLVLLGTMSLLSRALLPFVSRGCLSVLQDASVAIAADADSDLTSNQP